MDRASATASLENLYRIFTVPESAGSVLGDVDCSIITVKPDGFISPVEIDDVQDAPVPKLQAVAGS